MVNVLVRHPGNFVSAVVPTEDGRFQIEDLPPGAAFITGRSAGFAPFVGSTTVEGGKLRDVRIGLLLEARAEGQVRDAGGEPVMGASVRATYPELAGAGLVEDFVGGRPVAGPDGVFATEPTGGPFHVATGVPFWVAISNLMAGFDPPTEAPASTRVVPDTGVEPRAPPETARSSTTGRPLAGVGQPVSARASEDLLALLLQLALRTGRADPAYRDWPKPKK